MTYEQARAIIYGGQPTTAAELAEAREVYAAIAQRAADQIADELREHREDGPRDMPEGY
jgi:hypothetical protein